MKKTIVISIMALALIVGGAKAYDVVNNYYNQDIQNNQDMLGYQTIDVYKVGTSPASNAVLGVGLTQSITASTKNADKLDLNIYAKGSSTAAVINWTYSFSDDGTYWYSEDAYLVASTTAVTHGPSAVVHSWTPGTSGAYKNIGLTGNLLSRYVKATFTGAIATSSIYAEMVTSQTTQ